MGDRNMEEKIKDLSFLQHKNIRFIAIANPKIAPYGKASLDAIQNSKQRDITPILSKLVYANSIMQTLHYTQVKADIGFVAKSLLWANPPKNMSYRLIDPDLYSPIEQGIIQLKRSEHNTLARSFYRFMLSDAAKTVLVRLGYDF